MSESSPHVATVIAYFDAANAERFEDLAALCSPELELIAPGISPRHGPAGLVDYVRAALKPYAEHCDTPRRILVSGDTVTVEIHVTSATANGARLVFDAVDIFDFDAQGRIARLSSWYDSHAVRRQLRAALETTGATS